MTPFLVAFDARVELHPMLVHFPIVLLLATFGLDGVGVLTRREWLHRAGLLALALGTAGVAAAVVSGFLTPEAGENGVGFHSSGGVTGFFSGNKVDVHQNLGLVLLGASLVWLLMRLVLWGRSYRWRGACLGFGLLVVALVMLTGYYGGDVVYGPKVTIRHLSDTQFERGN